MQVALKIADRALPRRVVSKRNMHVRIDKPGDRRYAAGINDDVGVINFLCRGRACPRQAIAMGEDSITLDEGIAPITGNDLAEVYNRDLHAAILQLTFPR